MKIIKFVVLNAATGRGDAVCKSYTECAVTKKEDIDDSVLTELSQIFEEKNGEVELKKN